MDSLHYAKLSPAGNTTAIVAGPVPAADRPGLARQLMDRLEVEQVGFCVPASSPQAKGRLEMMGGEFCGNAARSFAVWLAMGGDSLWEGGPLPIRRDSVWPIEISGHGSPLAAQVAAGKDDRTATAGIQMPAPLHIDHGSHRDAGPYSLVAFEGIAHVVLWGLEASDAGLTAGQGLAADLGLAQADYGLMFVHADGGAMRPWVRVAQVGSAVWESSCGSGTVAVACAAAHRRQAAASLELRQPGGMLVASANLAGGRVARAYLLGAVELVGYGKLPL